MRNDFYNIGPKKSDIEVRISYRIIQLFSEGLYSSPNKAIEELVSNSFDAGAKLKQRRLTQAVNAVRASAEKGDARAQFDLASRYFYGKGVSQDFGEAARWCRKAAEQGDALAEFVLGSMYYDGNGVPQDYAEAVRWYRGAAEQGNPKGQLNLAAVYFYGKGVPQDYTEAFRWYRKAAEQGDAEAEFDVGSMYREGNGVQQDYSEAVDWYRKAASQGNAQAEYGLGYMYYYGQGLPQDYREAVRWYRTSANHGYPDARRALRSIEGRSTTATRIEYFVFLLTLVVGLVFSLAFLRPGRSFGDSRGATALGVVSLCNAGLSLYSIAHDDMRYSAFRNLFYLAQGVLIGMAMVVGITVVASRQKRAESK